jgi:hypothetical protein
MAIQISGTTVVNNSRELQNIASLDATTAATIGASAGGSTTYGDVGTYAVGRPANRTTSYDAGDTAAGILQKGMAVSNTDPGMRYYTSAEGLGTLSTLSGTWRCMTNAGVSSIYGMAGLWVRIS